MAIFTLITAVTTALITQTITTSSGTTVITTNDDGITTMQKTGTGMNQQGYPGTDMPGSAGVLVEKRVFLTPGQFAQHQFQFDPPGLVELYVPDGCRFTIYAKSGEDWPTASDYRYAYTLVAQARPGSPARLAVNPGLWYFSIRSEAGSGEYYLVARDARLSGSQGNPGGQDGEPPILMISRETPSGSEQAYEPVSEEGETIQEGWNLPGEQETGKEEVVPSTQPVEPVPPAEKIPAPDLSSCLEDRIFAQTNDAYVAGDYTRDPALDSIARSYSAALCGRDQNQGSSSTFSHFMDGNGPGERLTTAGYSWKSYSENIFHNGCSGGSCGDIASQALNRWLNSPGHRRNIMNENDVSNTNLGVGASSCGDGCYYVTELFATPA